MADPERREGEAPPLSEEQIAQKIADAYFTEDGSRRGKRGLQALIVAVLQQRRAQEAQPSPVGTAGEPTPAEMSRMEDAFFAGVTRAGDPRPIHENFAAWIAEGFETNSGTDLLQKNEPHCATCGHPKSKHPYRHPFVAATLARLVPIAPERSPEVPSAQGLLVDRLREIEMHCIEIAKVEPSFLSQCVWLERAKAVHVVAESFDQPAAPTTQAQGVPAPAVSVDLEPKR